MGIGRVKETGLGRKKETGALLGGQGQQFSHTSNEFAWIKKTITKKAAPIITLIYYTIMSWPSGLPPKL